MAVTQNLFENLQTQQTSSVNFSSVTIISSVQQKMSAKYTKSDLVTIINHKVDSDEEISFQCTVKQVINGKRDRNKTQTVWIKSNDPKQIHQNTLSRVTAFTQYYAKHGCSDFKSFKRNEILAAGGREATQHYLFEMDVIFNNNKDVKAEIKINENYSNSIYSKGSGVPITDIITQTASTKVFPKKFCDDVALTFVEDGQGSRHPVDGDSIQHNSFLCYKLLIKVKERRKRKKSLNHLNMVLSEKLFFLQNHMQLTKDIYWIMMIMIRL